jgi:predicted DNA-binding protein (UPF0251 family)
MTSSLAFSIGKVGKRQPANGSRQATSAICDAITKMDRYQSQADVSEGDLVTVQKAAGILGVVPSTLHRCLNAGFIVGEQIAPGAPWRIRMTEQLRARFVEQAPPEYLPMIEATKKLGVSRQTVWQRVKRGELQALYIAVGDAKACESKSSRFNRTNRTSSNKLY